MNGYKIAAALLPVALAWGALGWCLWRAESRRWNRLETVRELQRAPRLSERPDVRAAMEWRP